MVGMLGVNVLDDSETELFMLYPLPLSKSLACMSRETVGIG